MLIRHEKSGTSRGFMYFGLAPSSHLAIMILVIMIFKVLKIH